MSDLSIRKSTDVSWFSKKLTRGIFLFILPPLLSQFAMVGFTIVNPKKRITLEALSTIVNSGYQLANYSRCYGSDPGFSKERGHFFLRKSMVKIFAFHFRCSTKPPELGLCDLKDCLHLRNLA